jgi:hypothetical protein
MAAYWKKRSKTPINRHCFKDTFTASKIKVRATRSVKEDLKTIDNREEYLDLYKDKTLAFEKMLVIRNFEIELYWKRASYFWGLMAAIFAGYAVLASRMSEDMPVQSLIANLLACLGFVCAWAFYLTLRGSKFWQVNWEKQLYIMEEEIVGPLTKATINKSTYLKKFYKPNAPYPFSVSKVNQFFSKVMIAFWLIVLVINLAKVFLSKHYEIIYEVFIVIAFVGVLALVYNMITSSVTGIDSYDVFTAGEDSSDEEPIGDRTFSDVDITVRGLKNKAKK